MTKRKFYKAPAVEKDVSDPSIEIVDDDDDDDEDYASEGSESVSARNTFRDLRSKSATITDDAIFQVIKRVTCNTIRQFVCDEGISASRKRRRKVVYLDYLDFAHRTLPPPTIPRIKVWKQDMIKVIIMGKGQ
ncbi:hypothetical protein EJB05_30004 [Eragrostis curvula]|uniref:Uncharacterized protein n=1 Tax=Eragrostis curvula TaxID=38414 RepID=A0A5J9UUZ7_9POAL|nr:hypothetical protein EJB05_30004 [Eragrostis curvula]